MVPISALPPAIPFTDQMTGASVLNCMVWVTRRLLPVAWIADSLITAASLMLKPQPVIAALTIATQNAAALLCRLIDELGVHILRSALDRTCWKIRARKARSSP